MFIYMYKLIQFTRRGCKECDVGCTQFVSAYSDLGALEGPIPLVRLVGLRTVL